MNDPHYLWSHPSYTPRIARRSEASFAAGDPLWVAEYPVEVFAAPGGQEPVAIADGTFNCSAPLGTPLYAGPIAGAKVPLTETCEWSQDGNEDGSWFSACGGDPWCFEAEDPTKNGMRFCIHCGKRMVQRGIRATAPASQEKTNG